MTRSVSTRLSRRVGVARDVRPMSVPIYASSLFEHPSYASLARGEGYHYSRDANPTVEAVEEMLADLEGGEECALFSSGMAAITACLWFFLRPGDHVLAVAGSYPGTHAALDFLARRMGVRVSFVRGWEVEEFAAACEPSTRLVYLESPTSLLFHLQPIAEVTGWARERGLVTLVDNSWATPLFQQPLALGADLVVHSATKYLGGHSDLLAGAVVGRRELVRALKTEMRVMMGAVLSPFEAFLLLRGMRTLALRMSHHERAALEIAERLSRHPAVAEVYHPGLPAHPQYHLARRQMRGTSGLFAFRLARPEAVPEMVDRLTLFGCGVSWGGFESLVYPADVITDPVQRARRALPPGLVRVSVGLEDVQDLWEDLDRALQAAR